MKLKPFLILPALALTLGITSCDKDDDKYELPAATLTGQWAYSKTGAVVGGVEVLQNYDGNVEGCTKDYVDFGTNNLFADVDHNSDCDAVTDTGTYAVTGNTVVIDFGDSVQTWTIQNLSYTELKVKDNDSGEIVVFNR